MKDAGFIFASYAITFGAIALFALMTIKKGRALSAQVPDEEKYWT
jgi:heme exporter protein D